MYTASATHDRLCPNPPIFYGIINPEIQIYFFFETFSRDSIFIFTKFVFLL